MNTRIAYIDDSPANLECLATIFSKEFAIETFSDPFHFLVKYADRNYGSILLDLHMPAISGFSLYEKIMEHPGYDGCPVMFISSDDSDCARIKSLELGAVDFLSRELPPDELILRIKSRIKFYQQHRQIMEFEGLKINRTLVKAFLNDTEIPLTFIELKILCLILKHYPDIVLKETTTEHVWNNRINMDGTIYTHLSNLNLKLAAWTHEVQSVRRQGIRLVKKENR